MFSSLTLVVLVALAPGVVAPKIVTPPAAEQPPSPRAAALAAERANPPLPTTRSIEQGELQLFPRAYSLSQDPGFTPWSEFLTLGDDRIAHWSVAGSSFGGGIGCNASTQSWCAPLAQALVALLWRPHRSPVGVFAGASATSLADKTGMRTAAGFVAGLSFSTPSLVAMVRRARAGRD